MAEKMKASLNGLLGTEWIGIYKLEPLIIAKYKKAGCFQNVNNLPTDYTSNHTVWMTNDALLWVTAAKPEKKEERKQENS